MARGNRRPRTSASACRERAKRRDARCTLTDRKTSRLKALTMSWPPHSSRSSTITFRRNIPARRRKPCRRVAEESQVKISREDVLRVAELAYLDLSEAELETYRAQIDEILEYIGKLNELDTANVEPMAQVLSDDQTADATLREDLIVPCAVAEDVLKHAPDPEPPYFRVPKVIER